MISRSPALLIIISVWAAIYLPALGSLEIKGEEGRRILPAVRMLETGNYLVPQIGSEPYLRKPPLVNWLVAGSFKIFGLRSEWTARLPSVLCVLAVALVFITIARRSLGASGSTVAALIWLANFGMIEKGRLIEIEALYVSLFAMALVCWLSWWEEKRSPWLTWIVPWIFLGLGWLAKGPLHLFFFYAILIAVLWRSRELRTIWNIPHLIGFIVMVSIFAAWAIPFLKMTDGAHVAQVWSRQFSGRLAGEGINFGRWALNIPRSLGYFLPWLVFAPLLAGTTFLSGNKIDIAQRSRDHRSRLQPGAAQRIDIVQGLSWGIAIPLIIVDLIPGSLPRYTMPLLAPFAWLLASVLTAETVTWPRWLGGRIFSLKDRQRAIAILTIATCASICIYSVAIVPRLQARQKVKTIAAQIEAVVPESQPLYAVDPDYQPFLFYVRRPIIYVSRVIDLPGDASYFLVQPDNENAAETARQWLPALPRRVLSIQDYRRKRVSVFAIEKQ
jgi:4-amino-4-deoxy-L-arabinose transferase-like glycosyltransferase